MGLFAVAAAFALRLALRERRDFDGMVGAFCVFVAGEEFSWGQRLLGLTPPDAFLEHNRQQELTIHNFADLFGQPKVVLIAALVGFGLLLPLVARAATTRRLLERIGATAPRIALVPWFALAALLLVWYPHSFTGEWVEAMAGGLFLLAFAPTPMRALIALLLGALAALGMAAFSGRSPPPTAAELACARAEAQAIAEDLAYGTAATGRLVGARSVHKRVFTAIQESYVHEDRLERFAAVSCETGSAADRRRYVIDPWSTAYWLDLERSRDEIRVKVYSFGPNRRRDQGGRTEDDIAFTVNIRR